MCGRFFFSENIALDKYHRILKRKYDQTTLNLWKTGEVFPNDIVVVIDNRNNPQLMKWSFNLFSRKIINSRIESIKEKAYYHEFIQKYRCLIPVSGFYEWNANKEKHYIHTNEEMFYLDGIYQTTDALSNFSIITKPATQTSSIHNRCPIIFNENQARSYLKEFNIMDLLTNNPILEIETSQKQLEL